MKLLPLLALALTVFALPQPDPSSLEKRIINGEYAPNGAYPYVASLIFANDTFPSCGGSIISDTLIVTAAHCFVNETSEEIRRPNEVAIGFGNNRFVKQQFKLAEKIYIHPYYKPNMTYINDIAIVRVPKIPLDGKRVKAIDIYKG
ncbi:serine-type endopeptidase activity protein, partial [Dipsacomyces acuminosporus]